MGLILKCLVLGITLAISVGPVNLELLKRGVARGFLHAWLVGIGGMSADFIILFTIYLGLGTYFTSDKVQLILGCIGSILLIQMGLQSIRKSIKDKNQNFDMTIPPAGDQKKSFATGFLLAIMNPLNLLFWTGIYSSLLTVNNSNGTNVLSLIVSVFIGIATSNIIFALMASLGKSYLKPSTLRIIFTTSGIVIVGYGFWMGYTTVFSKLHIVY